MNSKQLKYIITLAETRNFSQAAQNLNISQPAFSKHIISVENEFGIKLFDRGSNPLSLTPAGEFFVQKAKQFLIEEEKVIKKIEEYKSGETGVLTIGIPPFRSLYLLPGIIGKIKHKFPKIQVVIKEHGLEQLKKELSEGLYDFAIMNLPVEETDFEVIPLEKDTIVLAVPNNLIGNIDNIKKGNKIDLADCKKLPFVVLGKNQEMRNLFEKMCAKAGLNPEIFVEVTGITTAREMVRAGVAATLLPKQFLSAEPESGNITLFELVQYEDTRQPAVVFRRGQYLSKYAQYAIEILKK